MKREEVTREATENGASSEWLKLGGLQKEQDTKQGMDNESCRLLCVQKEIQW